MLIKNCGSEIFSHFSVFRNKIYFLILKTVFVVPNYPTDFSKLYVPFSQNFQKIFLVGKFFKIFRNISKIEILVKKCKIPFLANDLEKNRKISRRYYWGLDWSSSWIRFAIASIRRQFWRFWLRKICKRTNLQKIFVSKDLSYLENLAIVDKSRQISDNGYRKFLFSLNLHKYKFT